MQMKPLNPLIPFKDGDLSVQASEFHYCTPRHDKGPYHSYEVAYFDKNDKFSELRELGMTDDQVYANVSKEDVLNLLETQGYTPSQIRKLLPDE
jgi:hypothetical protein|tara:strand:- start:745 stop:1026 length:282 start_codon:yes stop_codon:yes gene_type:complete